jgi:archaellum component FlaC
MGRTKQTPKKPKIDKLRDRLARLENQRERYLALLEEAKGIEVSEESIEKIKNEIEVINKSEA